MEKSLKNVLMVAFVLFMVSNCDLIDGTNVENPNLTQEAVLATPNPMPQWVAGMERQTALVFNAVTPIAELTTDNYININTFFDQAVDNLDFQFTSTNINNAQFNIADLRESGKFGLAEVASADPNTTDDQLAELHFFIGLAHLLSGELFTTLPVEPGEAAQPPAMHFSIAVDELTQAINLTTDNSKIIGYYIMRARVNYRLGNKAEATNDANAAISANPANDYVRFVQFDGPNGPTNTWQNAVFDRGGFDDAQPLPRLDFLDPKYAVSGTDESPIPLAKIEEAYLILAESQLADNDILSAHATMKDVVTIVGNRPIRSLDDAAEDRHERAPASRPDDTGWVVRASASDPFKSGLVLERKAGNVDIPSVSGTSVDDAYIDNLSLTDVDENLEALYLMRQEIFLGEARRIGDLGIRWPVSEVEQLNNPNITESDIQPVIPSFIPPGGEMDQITVDLNTKECTILHNVNRILVTNKTSSEVLPFF